MSCRHFCQHYAACCAFVAALADCAASTAWDPHTPGKVQSRPVWIHELGTRSSRGDGRMPAYQGRVMVQLAHRSEDDLGRHGCTTLDGTHDDIVEALRHGVQRVEQCSSTP